MKKRTLGRSGLEVVPLAFGGNVFGWTADEKTSFNLLDAFTDAGFNFIDTANSYSSWVPGNKGGESETIIGNWLKKTGKRDQIILATKVGSDMGEGRKGLSKSYIIEAVEESLKRLQTDYIDLYQSHYDDPTLTVEETLEAYQILIKAGKVRAIGASNFKPERLASALEASQHGLPRYDSLQPEYNLYTREAYETELETLCLKNGVGVIPYFALASGFLTGKYRSEADLDKSTRGEGIKKYLDERGFKILAALDQVAKHHETDQASVAIAWLLARPSITAPIASATSLSQLDALIKATQLVLDPGEIGLLNQASSYNQS